MGHQCTGIGHQCKGVGHQGRGWGIKIKGWGIKVRGRSSSRHVQSGGSKSVRMEWSQGSGSP